MHLPYTDIKKRYGVRWYVLNMQVLLGNVSTPYLVTYAQTVLLVSAET
jgi:hypothetical protein